MKVMVSIETKVLANLDKSNQFPRAKIAEAMDPTPRPFPGKKAFKCKKNKGEHTWVFVKPTCEPGASMKTYPGSKAEEMANLFQAKPLTDKYQNIYSISRGANVYQCSACAKIDVRWNPR